ncbi:hypothetical protein [Streptomyces erythrochromogenes]|uniref:hypothetical protein n=1 Tax=Streptomyces erythrochromogenes TaxID=285574 RepID=UPI0038674A93|nr:hypothetical protein OG364_29470 [Streptomyces erythrochromogenes]
MSRRPSNTHRPSVSRPGAGGLRWGMVATCVVRDSDPVLNAGKGKALYPLLMTYADVSSRDTEQGYPYRAALADSLDCTKDTVDNATKCLERGLGLITVTRRKVEGRPDENDANLYVIHDAWLIHGIVPPAGTPPQLVARYGVTLPGFDVDRWVAEHAPAFDLAAWRDEREATISAQEAKREAQRRKERERRKPKKKGGSGTDSATPESEASEGGSGTDSATRSRTDSATGSGMGAALSTAVTPDPSSTQDEPPVRPSVSVGSGVRASETDGRTDGSGGVIEEEPVRPRAVEAGPAEADAAPEKGAAAAEAVPGEGPAADSPPAPGTPGEQLLREISAWNPRFTLTGQTFTDQGRMVTGMLASGWKAANIREVITGRPLPDPLTRTVGSIVSWRLKKAAENLPPSPTATWGPVPAQPRSGEYNPVDHSSTAVAGRTVEEAKNHRVHYECAVCSREPVPGFDLCEDCAELPDCANGCGRRAPDEGEKCDACAKAWSAAGVTAAPTEDGKCPGRGGEPCDGRAQPGTVLGLCGRCRIAAETERRAAAVLVDAPF